MFTVCGLLRVISQHYARASQEIVQFYKEIRADTPLLVLLFDLMIKLLSRSATDG